MVKVVYIRYPLFKSRARKLEDALNKLHKNRSTIRYITSDNRGYTIVYEECKKPFNLYG